MGPIPPSSIVERQSKTGMPVGSLVLRLDAAGSDARLTAL